MRNDMELKIKATITDVQEATPTGYKYTFKFSSENYRYKGSFETDEKICNRKITIIVPLYFAALHLREGMPNYPVNHRLEMMTYKHKEPFLDKANVKYKKGSETKKTRDNLFQYKLYPLTHKKIVLLAQYGLFIITILLLIRLSNKTHHGF